MRRPKVAPEAPREAADRRRHGREEPQSAPGSQSRLARVAPPAGRRQPKRPPEAPPEAADRSRTRRGEPRPAPGGPGHLAKTRTSTRSRSRSRARSWRSRLRSGEEDRGMASGYYVPLCSVPLEPFNCFSKGKRPKFLNKKSISLRFLGCRAWSVFEMLLGGILFLGCRTQPGRISNFTS